MSIDDLDLSHPVMVRAADMARAWADRRREGHLDTSVIFSGPNGVGKTHLAKAIWWSMVHQALDEFGQPIPGTAAPIGRFFMANELLSKMGNSIDPETKIAIPTRASKIIGDSPLVVIDDLGIEQVIPFVAKDQQEAERHSRFFKAINHCYTYQISMIITTNLPIVDLASYVGRRSWDRLVQMAPRLPDGRSFMVDMAGVPSWRVKEGGR